MSELLKEIPVRVVGVSFSNVDGTSRQEILSTLSVGEALLIEYYEFENEPAYAVKTALGEQIGNLPKDLSADIYRRFRDCYFAAQIKHITGGGDGMKYGCIIYLGIYDHEPDFSKTGTIPTSVASLPEKTRRIYGVIFVALGVVLSLLGLLLLIVSPAFGILAIAGGILSVIVGRKYKKF